MAKSGSMPVGGQCDGGQHLVATARQQGQHLERLLARCGFAEHLPAQRNDGVGGQHEAGRLTPFARGRSLRGSQSPGQPVRRFTGSGRFVDVDPGPGVLEAERRQDLPASRGRGCEVQRIGSGGRHLQARW
jgi:hypothetical protein